MSDAVSIGSAGSPNWTSGNQSFVFYSGWNRADCCFVHFGCSSCGIGSIFDWNVK